MVCPYAASCLGRGGGLLHHLLDEVVLGDAQLVAGIRAHYEPEALVGIMEQALNDAERGMDGVEPLGALHPGTAFRRL